MFVSLFWFIYLSLTILCENLNLNSIFLGTWFLLNKSSENIEIEGKPGENEKPQVSDFNVVRKKMFGGRGRGARASREC